MCERDKGWGEEMQTNRKTETEGEIDKIYLQFKNNLFIAIVSALKDKDTS